MALPPNAFKNLFYGTDEAIYDRLRQEGCLSRKGKNNRDAVLHLMQETAMDFAAWVEAHPRMTGPNGTDRLADALLASPYVNRKARRLEQEDG